jgi:predicted RNA-binding Zn ribbon-like protein
VNAPTEHQWRLADPELVVALLSTLRLRDNVLVDELAGKRSVHGWLRKRQLPLVRGDGFTHPGLVEYRELLRELFTAVVDGNPPPRGALTIVNDLAARAPVTLTARQRSGNRIIVEPISQGTPADILFAELSRSALALLAAPARDRLGLCRAPGCVLFFLRRHPRQEWCSSNCGNRARVARHYARHAHE